MIVTRSSLPEMPEGYVICGNCRGTGQDGFGIMPDSFPCDGCGGKGRFKIDPNAKTYTLKEFMEMTLKLKEKPDAKD